MKMGKLLDPAGDGREVGASCHGIPEKAIFRFGCGKSVSFEFILDVPDFDEVSIDGIKRGLRNGSDLINHGGIFFFFKINIHYRLCTKKDNRKQGGLPLRQGARRGSGEGSLGVLNASLRLTGLVPLPLK